jgi:hypothetical protein
MTRIIYRILQMVKKIFLTGIVPWVLLEHLGIPPKMFFRNPDTTGLFPMVSNFVSKSELRNTFDKILCTTTDRQGTAGHLCTMRSALFLA